MKNYGSSFFILSIVFVLIFSTFDVIAQDDSKVENQLWAMTFLNFRLNKKWVYNQDFAYQHSYKTPTFTRFLIRSQGSYQQTGVLSYHGGLNFIYGFDETGENGLELRPWLGTKVRWPSFWRINFVQYLRFEQRFQHIVHVDDWDNNFRVRYKISTNIPINNESVTDKTLYGVVGYEFFSVSFGVDLRFTTAATHRVDTGFGFRQNTKNSYEVLALILHGRNEETEKYNLSSLVLYLRYKRYINWD